MQGMNSVALFLLRTAWDREDLTFWLLDALATVVIPGHWEGLSHISSAKPGSVTLRCATQDFARRKGLTNNILQQNTESCKLLINCTLVSHDNGHLSKSVEIYLALVLHSVAIDRALMRERTPELLEHLDSRGVPPEVLACDFFLSLGCRALPPQSVLRIWDMLFWEGGDILQYVALTVLRLAQVCPR